MSYDPTAEMQKGTTLRELIVNSEKLIVLVQAIKIDMAKD